MVRRSYIITTYGMAYRLQSSAIQLLKCLNVHKALEAATPIVKLRSCVITFNLWSNTDSVQNRQLSF